MRKSKARKWEGISRKKHIAQLDMRHRKWLDTYTLQSCLDQVRSNRSKCLKLDCIIARLVIALEKRGARI